MLLSKHLFKRFFYVFYKIDSYSHAQTLISRCFQIAESLRLPPLSPECVAVIAPTVHAELVRILTLTRKIHDRCHSDDLISGTSPDIHLPLLFRHPSLLTRTTHHYGLYLIIL
jgi:hypothetical protein